MTALTILQKASSRLGLSSPSAIFSSTDDQVIQLRNLLNQEGEELYKRHAWTRLTAEKTFTTVAAAIQTSAVPTDFSWYLEDTMWNRTTVVKVSGPLSAEQWQGIQAQTALALPDCYFRFRGGDILLSPTPTAGQTAAYEYVSKNWCASQAGTAQSTMQADTDVGLLDEALITLGVIWRFMAAKGLDYAEHYRTYQLEVEKAISRDGGRLKANLSGYPVRRYLGGANLAEGSWPI
jgi:hypothetical protein